MSPDIFALCDALVDEHATLSPVLATMAGIRGYDHLWDDFSTAGYEARRAALESQVARVRAADTGGDPWGVMAAEVAAAALEDDLTQFGTAEHLRDLNNLDSTLQHLRDVFEHMGKETREEWEAVVARLEALPAAAAAYRLRLEDGRRQGLAVARRQVVEGARQARHAAGEASSLRRLAGEYAGAGPGDAALGERVTAGISGALAAFAETAAYLERDYLPSAVEAGGVGEERYSRLARRFLGSAPDLRDTYAWGWEEVARLLRRMEETAAAILPGTPRPEVLRLLQEDPARAAASPEEFRQLMQARQEAALADLQGAHFDVPEPIRRVDVKLAPPGGALGAFYVGPSEDFTRPGTVWFALGEQQVVPIFDQVTTNYHEGFPGHHLQNGIQLISPARLSRFQKLLVWYPGSGEGWALYAEDIMEELGYLEKPDYLMGKLAGEMLRACRVVIDIGCHLGLPIPAGQPFHTGEEWGFETAVEMLVDYAAQPRDVAESEVTRYLGWPGQAIAYKVGQQAIRDLRAEAVRRHGPGFDRKAFHLRLLEIGAVGLDVLRRHLAGF
ncbi:MAG: uncharacterized protein H6Q11_1171 [Acidobacteria bacterium]|nr:uncharacterized protein [Acidobacteriota bacterium]